jgi:glucuronoarabinoxylan endo-1,4-beta-xylanase
MNFKTSYWAAGLLLMVTMTLGATTLATPSGSGTIIPSATQIIDASGNIWTLSSTKAVLENGMAAGYTANVALLLYYNGVVYQENTAGGWWDWNGSGWTGVSGNPSTGTGAGTGTGTGSGSGSVSGTGTAIPSATKIIDASHNIWTLSSTKTVLENGLAAGYTANVALLLYYNSVVYQENTAGGWWNWNGSGWAGVSGNPSTGTGTGSGSGSGSGGTITPATGTSTINWTDVHQVIDGFGASDAFASASMSTANQNFFFGTSAGDLGLSILRVAVPDNGGITGNCTSVGSSCAGAVVGDMKAALAKGARVYASPWSPPAAYKANGSIDCTTTAALATADYGAYATWLANFVESLQADGINLYALAVQNEPDTCQSYDSATWTAANYDSFVKSYLGPTFAADGLSTLIMLPEAGIYSQTSGYDATCGSDPACIQYVGGINWHDYDAVLTGTNTVTADPYPSNFPAGKKYWETESSCPGAGAMRCASDFTTDIGDALRWGAVVDQRIAVDGANAWLYWWLVSPESSDNQGLMDSNGTAAQRAYMLGQYGKFVRPGYYRIDATHLPQTGVSVSAYQNTATGTLVIIATNYTSAAVSQAFTLTNAPTFTSVTPTTTSSTMSLSTQTAVALTGNSITYTLPAQSITTFVGTSQ